MRYINSALVAALQVTTPEENPLLTDETRLMDVWFSGGIVRRQMFKRVKREEQEDLVTRLVGRGFLRCGNLLVDPRGVLFAEMENEILGGVLTIGFDDCGKPVELKVKGEHFRELCAQLPSSAD